jgi:hypothetical protein
MRHEARQVPSWLIFDVSQSKSRDAQFTGEFGRFACCESGADLWVARVSTGSEKKVRGVRGSRCRVCDSESQMRATLAVPAEKPDESRREFVARKNQAANKAPEPTPGLVTSRAEMASEMISSGKARLAPSPVVAHL